MSTQQYMIEKSAGSREGARLRYVTWAHYSEEWHSTLHTHACAELFFITGGHGVDVLNRCSMSIAMYMI